eukprot:TRINITY_DN12545_c0_g5_i1.p1 TRINITY_DN12545_c0_g5~~TRINITY_DN12545_c0_g5_i1.p1  ORF type:complete len:264 (-),score=43.03 TRINITY_DN12545_c0_g5_i1:144-935(-)
MYEKHQQQHKTLMRQLEEEKVLHGLIPCDICKLEIAFNQYEKHISAHSSTQPAAAPGPTISRTQSDPQMVKPSPSSDPGPPPNSPKLPQASGIFASDLVESKKTDKVRCEECQQEFEVEKIFEHAKIYHSEILDLSSKGSSSSYLIAEDPSNILCSVCNMLVHLNDIETHIETHNYDNSGDSIFYIAPKTEEELTRILYNGKGEEKECKLCYLEYVEKDVLIYLLCGHFYHEECILRWIRKKVGEGIAPVCPICDHVVFKQAK